MVKLAQNCRFGVRPSDVRASIAPWRISQPQIAQRNGSIVRVTQATSARRYAETVILSVAN